MRWTLIDQVRNGMRLRVALTLEPVTSVDTTGELLDEDGREEPSSVRAIPLAKCRSNVVPLQRRKIAG